jgi:hypothetical protein
MANFETAFIRSLQHEGATLSTSKQDTGNTFNGVFYGSFAGVTAAFLNQFDSKRLKDKGSKAVSSLTMTDVKALYKKHIWDRMMSGDTWQNQELANQIFDWLINKYGHALKDVSITLNMSAAIVTDNVNKLKFNSSTIDLLKNVNSTQATTINETLIYKRIERIKAGKAKISDIDKKLIARAESYKQSNHNTIIRDLNTDHSDNTIALVTIGLITIYAFYN